MHDSSLIFFCSEMFYMLRGNHRLQNHKFWSCIELIRIVLVFKICFSNSNNASIFITEHMKYFLIFMQRIWIATDWYQVHKFWSCLWFYMNFQSWQKVLMFKFEFKFCLTTGWQVEAKWQAPIGVDRGLIWRVLVGWYRFT